MECARISVHGFTALPDIEFSIVAISLFPKKMILLCHHKSDERPPAATPAPLQEMVQGSCERGAGRLTVNLALVSCSAMTMAVRVCRVGSPHVMLDSPSASAMKIISWSCSLQHTYFPVSRYLVCVTISSGSSTIFSSDSSHPPWLSSSRFLAIEKHLISGYSGLEFSASLL